MYDTWFDVLYNWTNENECIILYINDEFNRCAHTVQCKLWVFNVILQKISYVEEMQIKILLFLISIYCFFLMCLTFCRRPSMVFCLWMLMKFLLWFLNIILFLSIVAKLIYPIIKVKPLSKNGIKNVISKLTFKMSELEIWKPFKKRNYRIEYMYVYR